MRWDPRQYSRYADERGRPFLDLVGRIGADAPSRVVDVGCGPGTLTALLAARWPSASITGLDSSAEMIASAAPLASPRLRFEVGAAESFSAAGVDVLVSNATLQWVPTHRDLLRRWAAELPSGGWLAFQVPGNFAAPSHALMRSLASSPRWADRLGGVLRHDDAVDGPEQYARLLLDAGLSVDAWETTYLHRLTGADPVLEWVRGTGLRPVLQALAPDDAAEFESEYAAGLREAYPATAHGTFLPFRRVFAVASKP